MLAFVGAMICYKSQSLFSFYLACVKVHSVHSYVEWSGTSRLDPMRG